MMLQTFRSVRLGPEPISEALDHDTESLDRPLASQRPVETKDARPSESDPDSSFTGDCASLLLETNDSASNTVEGKHGRTSEIVLDAPQITAPGSGGASTYFDGLRDMPGFLRRTTIS